MDEQPKSQKMMYQSDQPSCRDMLQLLFDGVAENDEVKVEKQLALMVTESLSEKLSPNKGGKNPDCGLTRRRAAAGRGRAASLSVSPDPCLTEWMKEACMPWNPCRSFDAASYKCVLSL